MSGVRLRLVTPACLTTSGSNGRARLIRFCTNTWAKFRLTPGLKVTVSVYEPSLLDWDTMYSISSTPFTCCSIGAATDSATTRASAPGYVHITMMDGGVICGYCATGRVMTIDKTDAKIGRSIKKCEDIACQLSVGAGPEPGFPSSLSPCLLIS